MWAPRLALRRLRSPLEQVAQVAHGLTRDEGHFRLPFRACSEGARHAPRSSPGSSVVVCEGPMARRRRRCALTERLNGPCGAAEIGCPNEVPAVEQAGITFKVHLEFIPGAAMPSSPLAIFFDDPAQRALDVVNAIVRHVVLVHRHVVQSALSTQGEEQDVRLLLPRRWRLRRLEEGIGGSVNKHGRSAPNESFSYPAEDAAAQSTNRDFKISKYRKKLPRLFFLTVKEYSNIRAIHSIVQL